MLKVTFTCDHCGKSFDNTSQESGRIFNIQLTCQDTFRDPYSGSYKPKWEQAAHWCKPCVESLGMLPHGDPPKPEPSFQDRLDALMREYLETMIAEVTPQ